MFEKSKTKIDFYFIHAPISKLRKLVFMQTTQEIKYSKYLDSCPKPTWLTGRAGQLEPVAAQHYNLTRKTGSLLSDREPCSLNLTYICNISDNYIMIYIGSTISSQFTCIFVFAWECLHRLVRIQTL
jgi:hypothetical protein